MSKTSEKDIQLLSVLASGAAVKFKAIVEELTEEANSTANSLNAPPDAVEKAIGKAIDWLGGTEPFRVNSPRSYAKRLVRNAIIDYGRTHKEEMVSEEEIKGELAWIDESMRYFGEDEDSNEQARDSSWHGVKVGRNVMGRDFLKLPTIHYPEHGWLRALRPENLARCADWFFVGRSKNDCDKRWSQYKLTMALIENIPSLREQQIIKYFLWGYSTTGIAKELDVSKAYVSKVITKWLKSWGWDKLQVDRNRIILLTHYLATTYSKVSKVKVRIDLAVSRGCADERELADMLYRNVTKATETKAYFSDLRESDSLGLLAACDECNGYWYLPRRPRLKLKEWDEWREKKDEEMHRRESTKLIAGLPAHRRQLYINAWRDGASYFGDKEELKFLAELERKYCHKPVNF